MLNELINELMCKKSYGMADVITHFRKLLSDEEFLNMKCHGDIYVHRGSDGADAIRFYGLTGNDISVKQLSIFINWDVPVDERFMENFAIAAIIVMANYNRPVTFWAMNGDEKDRLGLGLLFDAIRHGCYTNRELIEKYFGGLLK